MPMTEYEVLHGPFDIETHRATFTNYLEVVLLPSGEAQYAVPSHQGKLEEVYLSMYGRLASESCPESMYCDYLEWLMGETGCVCLWSCGWMGRPNSRQRATILRLIEAGLVSVRRR